MVYRLSNNFLLRFNEKLNILQYEDPTVDTSDIGDLLLKAIAKYKNHPSIRLIQNSFKNTDNSSFLYVSKSDIEK